MELSKEFPGSEESDNRWHKRYASALGRCHDRGGKQQYRCLYMKKNHLRWRIRMQKRELWKQTNGFGQK